MSARDEIDLGHECYRRGIDRGEIEAAAAELVAVIAEDEAARVLQAAGVSCANARAIVAEAKRSTELAHPDLGEPQRRALAAMSISRAVRAWFQRQLRTPGVRAA